jgi:hypothetical protein
MNAKLLYVIIAVVVVGGGAYVLMSRDGNQQAETHNINTQQQTENTVSSAKGVENFTGSFDDLFSLGKDTVCTFHQATGSSTTDGTMYIAAGEQKVRGDFTYASAQHGTLHGGMISDGTTVYTWSETPQGMFGAKMSIKQMEGGDVQGGETSGSQQYDPTKQVDYNCSPWSIDESKFTLPSNVQFTDMSQQMQQLQAPSSAGGIQPNCSMCDSIPDASAKAQCRASLHCD